ncbi:MAG: M13-type metalloendopeptidase [Bowdeniella nasicola]|nr:M13-type metalloendopeptidase [Bowdeniella nasicola]
MSVRVQDNFFQAVNGDWLATHTIPADRARDGAFLALRDQAEAEVRAIIEACANEDITGTEATKIGNLYRAFMDTEAIESLGIAPLQAELTAVRAAGSKDELAAALGQLAAVEGPSPFGLSVISDFNDPRRYALYFGPDGLGLPDESYYREEAHKETRAAYRSHLENMVRLCQLADDPGMGAERILALETQLAAGMRDRVTARDIHLANNPATLAELDAMLGDFPLTIWREAAGIRDDQCAALIVTEPDYLRHLARVWDEVGLADWQLWAAWQLAHRRAAYLPAEIVEENFAFYGRTLTGAQQLRERWKRGVAVTEAALGEAVGKLFVAEHFPPAAKAAITHLVDNLLAAYRQSISKLEWMSPQTREKALEKLAQFTAKVGYPDRWRDYTALEIPAGDLYAAVRNAARFETNRQLAKLGGPIDRDEWLMTPQTVNAYYMPTMNEIVFPAAILRPPFFDPQADDATNYGGIGAVIGHEIGHGFDDQGSQFDGLGQVNNWWNDTDREEFNARTASLIDQYNSFVPSQLPATSGHHVNGALTIGENIGDLGGLGIALKAYEIALREDGLTFESAPEIDGRSALQRVFYSWAHIWREKARDEEIIRLLTIDPHSPAEFRCNGVVRNLDGFYQAFNVQPGDGMWLDEDKRVTIW